MKKVYLIAVIIALLTGISVYMFVTNLQQTTVAANTPTTPVVVARGIIPINTVFTEEMIEVRQLPSISVTPGTARTAEEIIGKISKYPLTAGEQIVIDKLKTLGTGDGTDLSYQLTGNERAITVNVDEQTGVSGFIRAGDTVDIITTETRGATPVTYYLLENVKVLKVSNKAANAAGTEIEAYSIITLCLTKEKSLVLGDAINLGKTICLTLRPVTEE